MASLSLLPSVVSCQTEDLTGRRLGSSLGMYLEIMLAVMTHFSEGDANAPASMAVMVSATFLSWRILPGQR